LHGVVSNPDGIGAVITSPLGERRLVRGGGQPYEGGATPQSLAAPSGNITIQWPSGITQSVPAEPTP
jgi:hypothetical protein